MTMNEFHFNELKQDTGKCDWLIGHIISISNIIKSVLPKVMLLHVMGLEVMWLELAQSKATCVEVAWREVAGMVPKTLVNQGEQYKEARFLEVVELDAWRLEVL